MPWVWVLIIATAGLALNMHLTSSSIVNPPLFVLALPVMALLSSRIHKQLSSFLWVTAIVGLIYLLWLARFYLYSQLLTGGATTPLLSLIPASVQPPTSGGLLTSINYNGRIYHDLLQLASLQFIVLLAFLSAVFVSICALRRSTFPIFYILINLTVIILFYTTETGFFMGYTAIRFLLSTAVAFVVLASGAIIGIFDDLLIGLRSPGLSFNGQNNLAHVSTLHSETRKNNRFGSIGKSPAYVILLILMILLLSIAVYQEFSNGYSHSADFAKAVDYPNIMGVTASVPWITKNTPADAIFLVTSGNTGRVWAMAMESRSFAALVVLFKNGAVAPYKDIGLSDVVTASNELGASYIIMDPIMLWFPKNNLTSFYAQLGSNDVNRTFAVMPANATLTNILHSRTLTAVRVVYVSNDTAKKVVILQPTTGSIRTTFVDNFTSHGDWSAYLNGSLTSSPGNLTLTAPAFSKDVYAAHAFQGDLKVTNSTFIIFRSRQDEASYSAYYLQFKSGKSASMIFDAGGLQAISLAQYAGENIQGMFLYDLRSDNAGGSAVRHAVTYDFVLIGDLVRP
jgi:hypothetical protein